MSGLVYLTAEDAQALWRPLSAEERSRAEQLIPVVEDCLRQEAAKAGYDLDEMVLSGSLLPNVVKAVVLDILTRVLRQSTTGEPLSQESQNALGYTWQGTYAIPGGGVANAILRSDLKRLGLRRQRGKAVDLCANTWDDSDPS